MRERRRDEGRREEEGAQHGVGRECGKAESAAGKCRREISAEYHAQRKNIILNAMPVLTCL